MADKKEPVVSDYEGDLYVTDYAPGIAELLRELSDMNEETVTECIMQGRHQEGDFFRRLSVLFSENLKKQVQRTYGLKTLSRLSLRALREKATHPTKAP